MTLKIQVWGSRQETHQRLSMPEEIKNHSFCVTQSICLNLPTKVGRFYTLKVDGLIDLCLA
jgi:hypothetical protein